MLKVIAWGVVPALIILFVGLPFYPLEGTQLVLYILGTVLTFLGGIGYAAGRRKKNKNSRK